MPRRRPSTLRQPAAARALRRSAAARPSFFRRVPKDGRLSGSAHAAIIVLEDWPGEIFTALKNWEREACASNRWPRFYWGCGTRGCCGDTRDDRDILDHAIHRLPKRPAQELRRLVESMDHRILARFPAKLDHSHRWWQIEFPWDYD